MSSINYDLKKIKAVVFDIDGVLSPSTIPMNEQGEPVRLLNVKDRYAIGRAISLGLYVAVISGAKTKSAALYYKNMGVEHLYLNSQDKLQDLRQFIEKTNVQLDEIAYAGDDMPDLEVMQTVGLPIAPIDAASEIKIAAKYISQLKGGEGIARDVIEQVLRAQNKWG